MYRVNKATKCYIYRQDEVSISDEVFPDSSQVSDGSVVHSIGGCKGTSWMHMSSTGRVSASALGKRLVATIALSEIEPDVTL